MKLFGENMYTILKNDIGDKNYEKKHKKVKGGGKTRNKTR